jgi:hypothetical protein
MKPNPFPAPNSTHSGSDEEFFKDSDTENTEDGFELCGTDPAAELKKAVAAPTSQSKTTDSENKAVLKEALAPEEPQPIPIIGSAPVGTVSRPVPEGHSAHGW